MRTDILQRKNEILQWIEENKPKSYMCRQLKCKHITLNSYLTKMGIEYNGNQGRKGRPFDPTYIPAVEYASKPQGVKPLVLKKKLIREGIRKNECEECGLTAWQGKPIPLELHHIDGNRFNNNLHNLQILCRNCHGLTPNHSGRNIGKTVP